MCIKGSMSACLSRPLFATARSCSVIRNCHRDFVTTSRAVEFLQLGFKVSLQVFQTSLSVIFFHHTTYLARLPEPSLLGPARILSHFYITSLVLSAQLRKPSTQERELPRSVFLPL